TFVATIVFIPYEIDELIKGVTTLKVLAFIINVAVAVYLLYAKRLFGLPGGGKAEHAEREADTGWPAVVRSTPHRTPQRSAPPDPAPQGTSGTLLPDSRPSQMSNPGAAAYGASEPDDARDPSPTSPLCP